jgi:hypothetical protein
MTEQPFDSWFDPIEPGLRDRTEDFPKTMFEAELEQTLARFRYARQAKLARFRYARQAKLARDDSRESGITGRRHGHRSRSGKQQSQPRGPG